MKAILITEEIKEKNKDVFHHGFVNNNNIGDIVLVKYLPSKFFVTEKIMGGYDTRVDLHEQDGFYEVITPEITENQYLGAIYFDEENNVFTYPENDYTAEEIATKTQEQAIANSQANRQALIQAKLEQEAISSLTETNDAEHLLANQDLFPMWQAGEDVVIEDVENNILPTRRLDFNNDNELVLWECLQPHTTQEDWRPKDTPALWKRVALPNEYLVWVQPTGAHDAYGVDDVIWYPTEGSTLYISTVNGNVYPPGIVAGQWEIYVEE